MHCLQDELTWMAAACIWTIAFDNQENKAAIREAGGIDMLVGLLQVPFFPALGTCESPHALPVLRRRNAALLVCTGIPLRVLSAECNWRPAHAGS